MCELLVYQRDYIQPRHLYKHDTALNIWETGGPVDIQRKDLMNLCIRITYVETIG